MASNMTPLLIRGKFSLPLVMTLLFTYGGQNRIFAVGIAIMNHVCVEKESIKLECRGEVLTESTWKFNGKLLYRNKIPVYQEWKDTLSLNSNYDLLITNVSVTREGHYMCIKDASIVAEHFLRVEVLPSVRLAINNETSSDRFIIEDGNNIRSTCHAEGSRPSVNLTWLINNESVDPTLIVLNEISLNVEDNLTFDSITTLQFQPNFVQGTITCAVHILSGVDFYNASVYITMFPLVQLLINGQAEESTTSISNGEEIQCVCVTKKSRPSVNVTWMMNNDVVDPSSTQVHETSSGSGMNQTFDTNSTLILPTDVKDGNITCIVNCLGRIEKYHASFFVKDNLFRRYFYYSVPGIFFLLLLSGLVIKMIQYIRRNRKFNITEEVEHESRDESQYQFENVNESNIATPPYSKCRGQPSATRCEDKISVKNITWLKNLSGEGQMVYWKAKVTTGAAVDGSYIIVRSLSDSAEASGWDTFRDLGCWLASLKKHKNIVNTLGVEISEVPYFIYHTYVGNDTLRKFLVKKYKIQSCYHNREDEESVCLMLNKFVCEIADGMLFLTREGYRHPGLSAKKVLLDHAGRCILYDFWPATLCLLRVRQIMQKPIPPVAWLPPETSQLLQYSDKSDVWAFGTVTWEIYSLGDSPVRHPFLEGTGYEVEQNNVLDRPDLCPNRLYKLVLSTWDVSQETRPSFEEIRTSLTCQTTDLTRGQNDETYEDTSSFYYQ